MPSAKGTAILARRQRLSREVRDARTLRRGAAAESRGFSRRASFDVSGFGGVRSFRLRAAYSLCASSRRLARRTRLMCRSKSPLLSRLFDFVAECLVFVHILMYVTQD